MGNLMSCVLICGAVEVVHVVHSDGHVERLIRPLKSNDHLPQNHKKQTTSSSPSLPGQADLMRCLSNLGLRTSSDSDAGFSTGSSYLLLPIRSNVDDSTSSSGDAFKYKRFSSFQFYKSAFLSPSRTLKPSRSSSSSKSLPPPAKEKCSSQDIHSSKKNSHVSSRDHQHHHQLHDDRKQLLRDSQPFKVKQEGGVTKLVVSKKYLAQLLSESNMKKSTSSSANSTSASNLLTPASSCCAMSKQVHDQNHVNGAQVSSLSAPPAAQNQAAVQTSSSGSNRAGRPSIWRPALESISETVLIAR